MISALLLLAGGWALQRAGTTEMAGHALTPRGATSGSAPARRRPVRYRRCVMPRSGSGSSAVWRLCLLGVTLLMVNDGRCRPTEL